MAETETKGKSAAKPTSPKPKKAAAEVKQAEPVKATAPEKSKAKASTAAPVPPKATAASKKVTTKATEEKPATAAPSREEIAHLAHRFWRERGGHHGSHEQDWLRAERELRGKAS